MGIYGVSNRDSRYDFQKDDHFLVFINSFVFCANVHWTYLYNIKTGATYYCNSENCKEVMEAMEEVVAVEGSKDSKKSKIPKKKEKKKSKIPKFKKN